MTMKIAEADGQNADTDFARCLKSCRGMTLEVEYPARLARDLHFIEAPVYDALQHQLIEVRKMLSGLIRLEPV